jgi:hypothetical protein
MGDPKATSTKCLGIIIQTAQAAVNYYPKTI